jgi:hypothetical protein
VTSQMRSLSSPSVSSPTIRTVCSCPRHFTTSVISSGGAASATAAREAASTAEGPADDEAAIGFGCEEFESEPKGSRCEERKGSDSDVQFLLRHVSERKDMEKENRPSPVNLLQGKCIEC